ncbi:MAG: hypothetical protein P8129_17960, partial [Anaerolineae bacterium]
FPGQMGLLADLDGIAAGETVTYTFPLAAPGTFLYEAGMTPNGARQILMGLYGGMVVRPTAAPGQAYDDAATAFDDEALLVLGAIDPGFNADPNNYQVQFFAPEYWLINGQAYPDTAQIDTVAGNTLLLRYVNASQRTQGMGTLGLRQLVIASDGYPLRPPYGVVNETIAAGQTMDMLLSVPAGTTTGTKFLVSNAALYNHNSGVRLADGRLGFGGMMTFINTVTGAAAWEAGPLTSNVAVAPNPTTGSTGVTLSADASDATTGGRNVVRVEYYVDTLGAPGTGIPMSIGGPALSVSASRTIPASQLATWTGGYHLLYVRARDAAGFWGVPGAVALNLDKIGPDSNTLNLSKDPTNGTRDVTLLGTGDDRWNGRSNVVAAQYTLNGVTTPMTLNHTNQIVAEISAVIPAATLGGLAEGLHPIMVESQDALGNWGAPGYITLTLDTTGPEAPAVTLTPDYLDMTQPLTVTSIRLDAVMTDALSSGVQSPLANAEAFVDAVGPAGDGFDLFPSDGLFDEVSESAYFDMPLAHFSILPHGYHTVTVHALDVAGNWGVYGEALICIDRGGGCGTPPPPPPPPPPPDDTVAPDVTNVLAAPNPTGGASLVTLTATATDPGSLSNVVAAEYYVNGDPGVGNAIPMQAADGAFDSPTENLTVDISVSGWPNVGFRLYVRAQDAAGNWTTPVPFVRLQVSGNLQQGVLQSDGFESGNLDAWSQAVGAVSVAPEASLALDNGSLGLQAALDGSPAYVSHRMDYGESGYQASFQFDAGGVDTFQTVHDVFLGLDQEKPILGLQVAPAKIDGAFVTVVQGETKYVARGWALAGGEPVYTDWQAVEAGARLGLRWHASEAGSLALLVDVAAVADLTGLDTSGYLLYEGRLGPSYSPGASLSGVESFDDFEALHIE